MELNFSRRSDLALSALQLLGRADGTKLGRAHLAAEIGTTPSFLAQVMPPLVQAGWVSSDRGPGGGYRLTPAASDIRLLDVLDVMEGVVRSGNCVLRSGPCPESACEVHEAWFRAKQVLIEGLREVRVLNSEEG